VLLPREEIDENYPKTYLSEKAIRGILRRKKEAREAGKGFGAQFLDLNKPSYTISARFWHDGYDSLVKYSDTEIRRLTVTELKRIQTFPDEYIIEGNYKEVVTQIGNAVACKFAEAIGRHLVQTLLE
jgi:DNA (cytosine-5)-methyltransferase 1